MPMTTALMRFADDLDDSTADLVVAALILNAKLRGPGLRDVLSSLASSVRSEVEMRGRISAGRRGTRKSVQIVVAITGLFVIGLRVLNPDYVEPTAPPSASSCCCSSQGSSRSGSTGCAGWRPSRCPPASCRLRPPT
jgi:hypothetical protein